MTKRRKRTAEEARMEALAAARTLLLSGGPNAITLTAVGTATGMTAANLSHHFGSAAGLQTALMAWMLEELGQTVGTAVAELRVDQITVGALIEKVFDAFAGGGGGYLAAWTAMSNNTPQFTLVGQALSAMETTLERLFDGEDRQARAIDLVLFVAIFAFGDSLIGPTLRGTFGRSDASVRELTERMVLRNLLDPKSPTGLGPLG